MGRYSHQSEDIFYCHNGGGQFWHLVGGGQRCYQTSYVAHTRPLTRNDPDQHQQCPLGKACSLKGDINRWVTFERMAITRKVKAITWLCLFSKFNLECKLFCNESLGRAGKGGLCRFILLDTRTPHLLCWHTAQRQLPSCSRLTKELRQFPFSRILNAALCFLL